MLNKRKYLFIEKHNINHVKQLSKYFIFKKNKFLIIFHFINFISLTITFLFSVFSILVAAKIIFKSYPSWFLIVAYSINALTCFIATTFNFFEIKNTIKFYDKQNKKIIFELFLLENNFSHYKDKKNKKEILIQKVNQIIINKGDSNE